MRTTRYPNGKIRSKYISNNDRREYWGGGNLRSRYFNGLYLEYDYDGNLTSWSNKALESGNRIAADARKNAILIFELMAHPQLKTLKKELAEKDFLDAQDADISEEKLANNARIETLLKSIREEASKSHNTKLLNKLNEIIKD